MSEWPIVKLGEVCKINPRRDKSITSSTEISFIEMKSLLENGNVHPVTVPAGKYLKGYTPFQKHDILIAKITPCFQNGKIGLANIDTDFGFGTTEFHIVRSGETLFPEYLTFFLRQQWILDAGEKCMTGSGGQRRVPKAFLENLKLPLPPLGEQKRIAEILGGVANAIHTVEQQIETANQLEKSLFNQFRRQYSALCSPIKNICKVQTGATPSRKNSAYYDGGIPWVKTGEVNGGKIEETEEYITELAVQETNCRKFPIGTILVAMYGQGATRGKVGILNCAAATNQACAALTALACEDQEYIFAVLRNCYDELRNLGRGGTQPNLNLTLVKEFEIPWPEEFAREEFSQKWRELDNLRHLLHRKLSLLQELQKSLANRAFAGLL